MESETSWLERVLIAVSYSDLNLLSENNSMLTRKLHLGGITIFALNEGEATFWRNYLLGG